MSGVPTGIRTPVTAVKGRCPRPLDDGDIEHGNAWEAAAEAAARMLGRRLLCCQATAAQQNHGAQARRYRQRLSATTITMNPAIRADRPARHRALSAPVVY